MPTHSLLAILGFSLAVSFGAVISPGPVTAAVISEAPRQGWKVGPLVAGGHSLLDLAMTLAISAGLSAGLATHPVRDVIGVAGGIVLFLFGASYLYACARGRMRLPSANDQLPRRSAAAMFGLGMLTTISNPFWYAWWVTVAAGYLLQASELGLAAVGVFLVGHVSMDLAWNTLLSSVAAAGRRVMRQGVYTALVVITGCFMICLGVMFVRSALAA